MMITRDATRKNMSGSDIQAIVEEITKIMDEARETMNKHTGPMNLIQGKKLTEIIVQGHVNQI